MSSYINDEEYIKQKYLELLKSNQEILFLEPMSNKRITNICDIVKQNYSDINAFTIKYKENKYLVLRHKIHYEEYFNVSEYIKKGHQAYSIENYDDCIDYFQKVITFGIPKANVYAKLGLSYYKKKLFKEAAEYLMIANYINSKENKSYDFTNLIEISLKKANEQYKPYIQMEASDFTEKKQNYYNLENVEEVAKIISNGQSIQKTLNDFQLDSEQQNLMLLIFAQNCYTQENYEIGDKFLNIVEKNKNKTPLVKSVITELKKNRLFYANRKEESKPLILTYNIKK